MDARDTPELPGVSIAAALSRFVDAPKVVGSRNSGAYYSATEGSIRTPGLIVDEIVMRFKY